ncbi:MAG: DRTGG domain-containing protein [Candidatus Ranarchaeia archaeon]
MSFNLYVSGTEYSGKTTVCLGLALKLKEIGLKVGYFKPIGSLTHIPLDQFVDDDVILMKNLLNLEEEYEELCPLALHSNYVTQLSEQDPKVILKKILTAFKKVSEGKDIVIIESSNSPETLSFIGLSAADISKKIDASIIFVTQGSKEIIVDTILQYNDYFKQEGSKVLGTVLTMVPPPLMDHMKNIVAPILKKNKIPAIGIICKRVEMKAPSIIEVTKALEAKTLIEAGNIATPIENFVVGAMNPAKALEHFSDVKEKAVILTGDRAEVALAAFETSTNLLILTGNIEPNPRVLETAREKGIPVIMSRLNTFDVVSKMGELTGRVKPDQSQKIALIKGAIDSEVNWAALLDCHPLNKNPIVKEFIGTLRKKQNRVLNGLI